MIRGFAAALALAAACAHAQQQPYAGQDQRGIKSLSADEVKQYTSGAGMGYAKPAEPNRYPGPMHVLELADKLELTQQQLGQVQALMDAHKAEARAIGAKSVEPCKPEVAQRHSGYLVGGTSPFGTRKVMRVFVESTVLALPRIFINGGRRGDLEGIEPRVLSVALGPKPEPCLILLSSVG